MEITRLHVEAVRAGITLLQIGYMAWCKKTGRPVSADLFPRTPTTPIVTTHPLVPPTVSASAPMVAVPPVLGEPVSDAPPPAALKKGGRPRGAERDFPRLPEKELAMLMATAAKIAAPELRSRAAAEKLPWDVIHLGDVMDMDHHGLREKAEKAFFPVGAGPLLRLSLIAAGLRYGFIPDGRN